MHDIYTVGRLTRRLHYGISPRIIPSRSTVTRSWAHNWCRRHQKAIADCFCPGSASGWCRSGQEAGRASRLARSIRPPSSQQRAHLRLRVAVPPQPSTRPRASPRLRRRRPRARSTFEQPHRPSARASIRRPGPRLMKFGKLLGERMYGANTAIAQSARRRACARARGCAAPVCTPAGGMPCCPRLIPWCAEGFLGRPSLARPSSLAPLRKRAAEQARF